MEIFFDIRTLSLFSGCISACLFMGMAYIYQNRKTYPGFRQWTSAYFLNFLGFIFLSLRHILPDFISIVLANLFIVLCFVMIARGLIYFSDTRQNIWTDMLPPAVLAVSFFYFVYLSPNLKARIIVLSLIMIFVSLRCVLILHRKICPLLGEKNWFLTTAFLWVILGLFSRVLLTLSCENRTPDDFMLNSTIQGVSIITGSIGLIFIATGLIIINAQRLENDLIRAGREIKTLRGFLPICAHCKKIRDDRGYWQQIESYIKKHSDVTFTHGICDDCLKKYYPDLSEEANE